MATKTESKNPYASTRPPAIETLASAHDRCPETEARAK